MQRMIINIGIIVGINIYDDTTNYNDDNIYYY